MPGPRQPPPPLAPDSLERMALRYVERFATTRARLATYLRRKLRERGWAEGAGEPQVEALAERLSELGYIDDRAFGEAKAGSMARRGLGARRVTMALRHAGVVGDDAEAIRPGIDEQTVESALRFARRKRLGPYASEAADRPLRQKHLAAMMRAGHAPDLSRRIVAMAPIDAIGMSHSEEAAEFEAQLIRSLS